MCNRSGALNDRLVEVEEAYLETDDLAAGAEEGAETGSGPMTDAPF